MSNVLDICEMLYICLCVTALIFRIQYIDGYDLWLHEYSNFCGCSVYTFDSRTSNPFETLERRELNEKKTVLWAGWQNVKKSHSKWKICRGCEKLCFSVPVDEKKWWIFWAVVSIRFDENKHDVLPVGIF